MTDQLHIERIYSQKGNYDIYVWNKLNSKLLFATSEISFIAIILNIEQELMNRGIPVYDIFNVILGITSENMSPSIYYAFVFIANIMAEVIGIGGASPSALLNLNAIINYQSDTGKLILSNKLDSPLGILSQIYDTIILVQYLAENSILCDAFGYWNTNFIAQDINGLIKSHSGYSISNLLGRKNAISNLHSLFSMALKAYSQTDVINLIATFVKNIAMNKQFNGYILEVFKISSVSTVHTSFTETVIETKSTPSSSIWLPTKLFEATSVYPQQSKHSSLPDSMSTVSSVEHHKMTESPVMEFSSVNLNPTVGFISDSNRDKSLHTLSNKQETETDGIESSTTKHVTDSPSTIEETVVTYSSILSTKPITTTDSPTIMHLRQPLYTSVSTPMPLDNYIAAPSTKQRSSLLGTVVNIL